MKKLLILSLIAVTVFNLTSWQNVKSQSITTDKNISVTSIKQDTGSTGIQTPTGIVNGKLTYTGTEIPDNPTLPYMLSISKEPTADMYGPSDEGATDSVVHYSRVGISGLGQNYWHSVETQEGVKDKIYHDGFYCPEEIFCTGAVSDITSNNNTNTQHIMVFGDGIGFTTYLGNTSYDGGDICVGFNLIETEPSKFIDFNVSVLKNSDSTQDYTTEFNNMVKTSIKASSTQMDHQGWFDIIPSKISLDGNWYFNGINEFVKLISITPLNGYKNINVYRYIQRNYNKEWYDVNPSQPYDFDGEVEKNDYVYSDPTPVPTKTYTSTRIWGQQRMDTAEEIAKNFNSDKVSNVVLTYAFNYPDALSASTLAAKLNAPILLSGGSVSTSVQALDYINNHLAKGGTVYILGGSGVIIPSMDTYLQGEGFTTKRLGGSTRYDTNASIVDQETVTQGTPVILAYQGNFPDALSASGIASIKGYPILYSDVNSLPQQTINELKKIKPSTVYITGDTGVISDNVKTTLKSILGISDSNIIRMGGPTRFDTCLDIAKQFNLNTNNAVIAYGYNFPDALTGSVLCQKYNAPLIIIDNSDVSKQKTYLDSTNITNLYVLGGNGVVSDDALSLLKK